MPRLNAKLIAVNIPARNTGNSSKFYQALFGTDFARSWTDQSNYMHTPLTEDGMWAWLSPRLAPDEGITAWFAVDNLDQTVANLERAGGQVVQTGVDAPISPRLQQVYDQQIGPHQPTSNTMGKFALIRDPDGNHLWIGQLEEHATIYFKVGTHDVGLSQQKLDAHNRVKTLARGLP